MQTVLLYVVLYLECGNMYLIELIHFAFCCYVRYVSFLLYIMIRQPKVSSIFLKITALNEEESETHPSMSNNAVPHLHEQNNLSITEGNGEETVEASTPLYQRQPLFLLKNQGMIFE